MCSSSVATLLGGSRGPVGRQRVKGKEGSMVKGKGGDTVKDKSQGRGVSDCTEIDVFEILGLEAMAAALTAPDEASVVQQGQG